MELQVGGKEQAGNKLMSNTYPFILWNEKYPWERASNLITLVQLKKCNAGFYREISDSADHNILASEAYKH